MKWNIAWTAYLVMQTMQHNDMQLNVPLDNHSDITQ
jgi:hypothetical protein